MKRILVFTFLFFNAVLSAQNAASILDKAAEAYKTAKGVNAAFTMRIHSEKQPINESSEGEIQIKGNKFTLKTPDMRIWFDGQTQWTYMLRTEEVNVTNPQGEDLMLMNPALLLQDYKKGFKAEYVGESTSTSGKSAYDVALSPRKKGDIERIDLQVEKQSGLPASIRLTTKDGMTTTIRIQNMQTGLNLPDNLFVFNTSDFPDVEVIDLR